MTIQKKELDIIEQAQSTIENGYYWSKDDQFKLEVLTACIVGLRDTLKDEIQP